MVVGRNFHKNMLTDDKSVIINEAAAKKFGWEKDPLSAKFIGFTPHEKFEKNVIGVVRDFHLGVSYQFVHPTIIFLSQGSESNLYVRISQDNSNETLAMMTTKWNEHFPDYKMEYSFVDQDLNTLYNREENFLTLLSCLCAVIIFIASLGIIGLISYTTELRKKEIAIRKVLGSSFRSIIGILTRKFVFLLIVANLLAVPATWYLIDLWLSNFAYKTEMGFGTFLAPFFSCILFTAISIGYHATRAALANPVDALKCE